MTPIDKLKASFTIEPDDLLVVTRPIVWKRWLLNAQWWVLGAVGGVLFSKFLFPLMASPVFKKLYPSKQSGGFLDSIFGSKPEGLPLWRQELNDWTAILVYLSITALVVGLWHALRATSAEARDTAEMWRAEGESQLTLNPQASIIAFRKAIQWTTNVDRRKGLEDAIARAQGRTLASTGSGGAAAAGQAVASGHQPAAASPVTSDPYARGGTEILTAGTMVSAGSNTVGPNGRYELRKLLGKGGMGEVHEALDTSLDRVIALKKLPSHLAGDQQFLTRFTQEAKALAKVSHPFIVQVYDILNDPTGSYIALEFISGGDLQTLLEKDGALPPETVLSLGKKIAEGLAFAHEHGIVHRDIKPLNILLTKDRQPKLTDFGLAKLESSVQLTVDGAVMGSPAYMSPEQAAGKTADFRSDVYSFGVMLYAMATGRPPYDGDTQQVLAAHLTQRVPTPGGIPESLATVIEQATEPKAESRYANGRALVEALEAVRV